jgi:hypothetical protein
MINFIKRVYIRLAKDIIYTDLKTFYGKKINLLRKISKR